jgi:hypothetical protein
MLKGERESGRFSQAFDLVRTSVNIIVVLLQRITRRRRKYEFHCKGVSTFVGRVVEGFNISPIDNFVQYLSAAMTNLTMSVQKAEKASFIRGVLIAWR